MQDVQREIARQLNVQPPFANDEVLQAEVSRRVQFIKDCLHNARLKVLVLGISGGVDSLTAGLMAQRAIRELRESTGDNAYTFVAVRLPYHIQHDEHEATASWDFIKPDARHTVDIAPSVKALVEQIKAFEGQPANTVDFVKGNIKARARMVAQYAIAGVKGGLVIGTDHAAEAVMGFYTKFGDGACDLAPLSGLGKTRALALARGRGAPQSLAEKAPTAALEERAPGNPHEAAHGSSYAEIDAFRHGEPVKQETAEIIVSTYRKTQHKRDLPYAP